MWTTFVVCFKAPVNTWSNICSISRSSRLCWIHLELYCIYCICRSDTLLQEPSVSHLSDEEGLPAEVFWERFTGTKPKDIPGWGLFQLVPGCRQEGLLEKRDAWTSISIFELTRIINGFAFLHLSAFFPPFRFLLMNVYECWNLRLDFCLQFSINLLFLVI